MRKILTAGAVLVAAAAWLGSAQAGRVSGDGWYCEGPSPDGWYTCYTLPKKKPVE